MDADALRDAITREVIDYRRRPQLVTSQTSYILRRVSYTGGSTDPSDNTNCQPATSSTAVNTSDQSQSTAGGEFDQSRSTAGSEFDQSKSTAGSEFDQSQSTASSELTRTCADTELVFKVPGISTMKGDVDGNSMEMPSASTCLAPSDVTMLSARHVTDDNIELSKDEFYQHTNDNNGDQTDTNIANDNRTDSNTTWTSSDTVVVVDKDNRSVSNCLVVNTEPPQSVDAKARIKAALLNSGRRRQRLREYRNYTLYC